MKFKIYLFYATPLILAIRKGNLAAVKRLMEHKNIKADLTDEILSFVFIRL